MRGDKTEEFYKRIIGRFHFENFHNKFRESLSLLIQKLSLLEFYNFLVISSERKVRGIRGLESCKRNQLELSNCSRLLIVNISRRSQLS